MNKCYIKQAQIGQDKLNSTKFKPIHSFIRLSLNFHEDAYEGGMKGLRNKREGGEGLEVITFHQVFQLPFTLREKGNKSAALSF